MEPQQPIPVPSDSRITPTFAVETDAVHAGEPHPKIGGALAIPIFQSSVCETAGEEDYHDIRYIRLCNTPNHFAVQQKLAALERGEAALVTASGMAAITTTLLTILSAGDHLLSQASLYAGVPNFLDNEAVRLGITYSTIDSAHPESWRRSLRPSTKVIYVEAIGNPLLQIPDFRAVVEFARTHGLLAVIDNTFATPINFRPLQWGFDLCLHSCTKFLNGHSDLVAGAVVGREELIAKIRKTLIHLGGTLNPISCYLLHRSLKTLPLRIQQQNANAMRVAEFLQTHRAVTRVYYPGIPSDHSHNLARKYLDGYGGIVSFEIAGDVEATKVLFGNLRLIAVAPSLGGVETSITRPAATSHYCIPVEDRIRMGIRDNLLRLSVGVENATDLTRELAASLDCVSNSVPGI